MFDQEMCFEEEYFSADSTREDDPMELQLLYQMLEEYAATDRIRILNPHRMQQMLWAKAILERAQLDNLEDSKVEIIDTDTLPGACALTLETDYLMFNSHTHYAALSAADNVEVIPLCNGRMQMNLMFYNVYHVEAVNIR